MVILLPAVLQGTSFAHQSFVLCIVLSLRTLNHTINGKNVNERQYIDAIEEKIECGYLFVALTLTKIVAYATIFEPACVKNVPGSIWQKSASPPCAIRHTVIALAFLFFHSDDSHFASTLWELLLCAI